MDLIIIRQMSLIDQFNTIKRNYQKLPESRLTKGYLVTRLKSLEDFWKSFRENDEELRLTQTFAVSKYNLENIYDSMDELYFDFCGQLEDTLSTMGSNNSIVPHSSHPVIQAAPPSFRLPNITLPTFAGDYATWSSFSDMFISLIHNDKHLTKVQKLHYLKSNLRGPAEQLLRHTAVTNDNYDIAWKTLTKRYANKKALVDTQLKLLLSQSIHCNENAKNIRDLIDTTKESLNALRGLEIDVQNWDPLLLYLLIQKLSKETHTAWETHLQGNAELPSFDDFIAFLENRFRMLESLSDHQVSGTPIACKTSRQAKSHATISTNSKTSTTVCPLCSDSHYIRACPKFLQMDVSARKATVKQHKICFNCLVRGHLITECRNRMNCQTCNKRHHTLLHEQQSAAQPSAVASHNPEVQSSVVPSPLLQQSSHIAAQSNRSSEILLATAVITAVSSTGALYPLRALIDQGSQVSFLTERAAQRLRLKTASVNTTITGIAKTNAGRLRHCVQIQILSSQIPTFAITTNALIMTSITGNLPVSQCSLGNWPHLSNLTLADPTFHKPGDIDVLLGADVYGDIILPGLLKGEPGTPIAQSTVFGWILSGKVESYSATRYDKVQSHITTLHSCIDIDNQLKKFWEIEEMPTKVFNTPDETQAIEHFNANHSRNAQGRYIVRLPLKSNALGESRNTAVRRLHQVERRLATNPDLKTSYSDFMKEYIALGHMKPSERAPDDERYYIPHHAVFKESSSTTKVRVVFDASSKTTNGQSLNDLMLVGPTMQDDLSTILLRWRKYPIAFTADIEKMYRQILVHPSDQHLQHILWRDDPSSPIIEYALQTVTYGTSCAPHLAVSALKQVAIDESHSYPIGALIVYNDFYVDDLMSGSYSSEEALNSYQEVNNLLAKGGFKIRKWVSNHSPLLEQIPSQDREIQLPLNIELMNTVTALGITWNPASDHFSFNLKLPPILRPATKRIILSDVSKLFDPMGWLAPVIIRSKIFMQQLWVQGVQWDDPLATPLINSWEHLRNDLQHVNAISIERWMCHHNNSVELHGFCDASMYAYAAVIYSRIKQPNGTYKTTLLTAKTRVAPLKQISIPRLELCGAALLAELLTNTQQNLKISSSQVFAWTDSSIVLHWIRSTPSRWKTFVANRVSNIQEHIPISSWKHVPTAHNPADCASRGMDAQSLRTFELWWLGPKWLTEEYDTWPHQKNDSHTNDIDQSETRKITNIATSYHSSEPMILMESFSSLNRLLRVTSYCKRFISKCRKEDIHFSSTLSAQEQNNALNHWICISQKNAFYQEIELLKKNHPISSKSSTLTLTPYLDDIGLMRVGGRLQNSNLTFDEKHPIILDSKCHLTKLIIRMHHIQTMHGGAQLVLGLLRKRYWVINARSTVRSVIHRCITCHRYKISSNSQLMGNLPEPRVNITRAFTHTGVDYAGPIDIRMSKGRGNASYKGYISIFICLSTKAVHIEAVSDLTSNAFIAAYRRFVSRRGLPHHMYSDNGTNFVGAVKSLRKSHEASLLRVKSDIIDNATKQNTEWHFIPPSSPHFGGLWEAGVKSLKHHLKRTVGNSKLTYEELSTLLIQVEACMNSRPLAPLTSDITDITALTPGHFLIGDALLAPPDRSLLNENISSLTRWQLVQRLYENIALRWQNEYLSRLQQRPKWTKQKPNIEIGDLVLLKESNISPASWPLARVVDTHPGSDGLVRVVTVRTPTSSYKRAITKISPLPENE